MEPELSVITAVEDLDTRLPEWDALFARCGQVAPFCGPRVWVPWLKSFPGQSPAVFELRDGERLRALLPMYRCGDRLEMAAGPHLDYQDLLADDDEPAVALLLAVLGSGGRSRPSLLSFPNVQAGSRLDAALADSRVDAVAHQHARYLTRCSTTDFVLRGGDDFLAALSGRQRRDYRAAAKKIAQAAPGFVVEHFDHGEIPVAAVADAAELHRRNQHRKKGPSIFGQPGFVDFIHAQSAAGAPVCLSLLRESPGGPLMAFTLGYFAADTVYFYLTSYAGHHAACSPGRWIMTEALRHWSRFVKGDTLRFDLLGGEESYKERWAKSSYTISRVVVIPRGMRNLPRLLVYSAVYGLKSIKNRWLGKEREELPASGDVAGLAR